MSDLWRELRARNVGGSEIAALFNLSPYTTHYRIWHEKRGLLTPVEIENERIQAGQFLEPAIIQWANAKWGLRLQKCHEYVEHPTLEGMGCTPDAFDLEDTEYLAQIKNVDGLRFSIEWEAEGDTITKAPIHILLQVQHEMEACQKKHSYLIVCVGGNRLYVMDCKRDDDTCRIIRNKIAAFWASTEPPSPEFDKDADTIARIKKSLPAMKFDDLSDDMRLYKILKDFQKFNHKKLKANDQLEALKAEITYFSKQYEAVRCRDIVVTFKNNRMFIKSEEIPL